MQSSTILVLTIFPFADLFIGMAKLSLLPSAGWTM